MIKSVAQTIPTYVPCFLLPKELCQTLAVRQQSSGGTLTNNPEECIGQREKIYAYPRRMAISALNPVSILTRHFWVSNSGVYTNIPIHWPCVFLKEDIFERYIRLMHQNLIDHLMIGGVYGQLRSSFCQAHIVPLAMEQIHQLGQTDGLRVHTPDRQ